MIRSTSRVRIVTRFVDRVSPDGRSEQVMYVNLGRSETGTTPRDIRDIEEQFGITNANNAGAVGIVTRIPSGLRLFNFRDAAYLFCSRTVSPQWTSGFFNGDPREEGLNRIMKIKDVDDDLAAAWEGSSFAVRLRKSSAPAKATLLGQVYDALLQKDAAIFLTADTIESPKELVISVRSHMVPPLT